MKETDYEALRWNPSYSGRGRNVLVALPIANWLWLWIFSYTMPV